MKNKTVKAVLENKILPFVVKPGRYVGNEYNVVHKNPDVVELRIALAFPEVYEIAMSYVGFDILYHVLNRQKNIWAERVYAPWTDMDERLRAESLPLHSLESFTPIKSFDLIGFTLQYELTYTNVLNMLELSGVPVRAKDRNGEHPIVFAGGPCSCNPEPMADFIDAFLIGDGEEAIVEICNLVARAKKENKSRADILAALAEIRGVYVPAFYDVNYDEKGRLVSVKSANPSAPDRVLTRILPELKQEYYPDKPLVPLIEVTHNRLSLEVMRGCTEGCRYCNAGMIYRPTRERDRRDVVDQMNKGLQNSGYNEVSFLSLSISDYQDLNALMGDTKAELTGQKVSVSFPSMRLDSFSNEIAEFVSSVRKSGFTFAPEAGSERLRQVINKNITEKDLYESVAIALKNGWKLLKFYFMIGLPTETKEDVEEIANLIDNVVSMSRSYGNIRFNVSVSPFSPKAHTPFQWERQDTREEFLEKIEILRKRFSRIRQVKLSWRDPDVSLIECVLGRGDRQMSGAIFRAWKMGARFDGWSEHFKFDVWLKAFDESSLKASDFSEALSTDNLLAWEHIDKGVSRKFLLKERTDAYKGITSIDCKDGTCHGCGIQRKGGFAELTDCYKNVRPELLDKRQDAVLSPESNKEQTLEENSIRIRVQYEKTAYARYLSHLDLIRIFERSCRLAGIKLVYSQGFNPHPKLSFGPSLSLGYSSGAEYMDMEIYDAVQDDFPGRLNPYLPEGIRLVDSKPIIEKVKAITAVIDVTEYEVDLSANNFDNSEFEIALNTLLNAEEIVIDRIVKGKQRTVDIRPFIESIEKNDQKLFIKTRTLENRTVRIREILKQLFGQEQQLSVHRRNQLIRQGVDDLTPLDILP